MRRRVFLMSAAASVLCRLPKTRAQNSLGTLTWLEAGTLWVRELPDGTPLKLASGEVLHSPRISPSGRWIAFEDNTDKRWLIRRDGRTSAALDSTAASTLPQEDLMLLRPDAAFAPDGRRYAFSRDLDTANGPSVGQLCLSSLDTPDHEPEILVWDQNGAKEPFSWTHDGKSVIYWNADEWGASPWADGISLSIVDVASGRSRELGVSALHDFDMLALAPAATGNRLAVADGGGRETWSDKRVAAVDLDTGRSHNLTSDEMASMGPAWSPNGERVACFAAVDAELAYMRATPGQTKRIGLDGYTAHPYLQQRKIWLLDPNGANPQRQLTDDPRYRDEEPLWSADGSHILFGRMDYEGDPSLWLMEANGSAAVQVCHLQGGDERWFGYYGYIDWHRSFDWRATV